MLKIIYNIIFWTSRFITASIFSVCFIAVLNAKYMFSETFFSNILKFSYNLPFIITKSIPFSLSFSFYMDTNIYYLKYPIYKSFYIRSQNIDLLLTGLVLILIIQIYFNYFYIKKNKIYIIISVIYISIAVISKKEDFLVLAIITPIVFLMIKFLNNKFKYNWGRSLVWFPFIGEIFCIKFILNKISNKISEKKSITNFFILLVAIIFSDVIYFVLPYELKVKTEIIHGNSVYNINILKEKIVVSSVQSLFIIDNNKNFSINNNYFYQDIAFSQERKEIYIYDTNESTLYILNDKNYSEINKITLDVDKNLYSSARLLYDKNLPSNVFLVFEDYRCYAYLINLDNKKIKRYRTHSPNDNLIYNKYRNSYILTFYQFIPYLQEIDVINKKTVDIKCDTEQGYICISERNKEVYVAFHQQGRIGVYDAETMALKRKIKTNYTVKNITYDEELNILIAPAYFTGYVDIFLMDGTDKLLTREFIGYELREAKFDYEKENLYICSRKGLYKFPLNIKDLINSKK